jgi:hypothetical protein
MRNAPGHLDLAHTAGGHSSRRRGRRAPDPSTWVVGAVEWTSGAEAGVFHHPSIACRRSAQRCPTDTASPLLYNSIQARSAEIGQADSTVLGIIRGPTFIDHLLLEGEMPSCLGVGRGML